MSDASGAVLGVNRCDPYGVPAASKLGRFLQTDPIGYDDDLNLYAYVGGDPVNKVDPDGRQAVEALRVVFASDMLVPDPTDVAWPKWAGWAVAFGAAAAIDYALNESKPADPGVKGDQSRSEGRRRPVSNPKSGQPGSVKETKTKDGSPKQTREYGDDGFPDRDFDYDHKHGGVQPHVHDWTRPSDGSDPTKENRQPGRPPTKEESERIKQYCTGSRIARESC